MAKIRKQIRGHELINGDGHGASFEHHEIYDDNLLPDAAELQKLKELDQDIMPWLKSRTELEQDARIDREDRRLGYLEGNQSKAFTIDIIVIMCAFVIMIGGMCISGFLLYKKEILTGSLFGGATVLFAARSFLNFRKNLRK